MADDSKIEIEEGREVVRRTIVGGRPRARKNRRVIVPIGIEKVLCRAAADNRFKATLFQDRESYHPKDQLHRNQYSHSPLRWLLRLNILYYYAKKGGK